MLDLGKVDIQLQLACNELAQRPGEQEVARAYIVKVCAKKFGPCTTSQPVLILLEKQTLHHTEQPFLVPTVTDSPVEGVFTF